jgi:hypothetical protein
MPQIFMGTANNPNFKKKNPKTHAVCNFVGKLHFSRSFAFFSRGFAPRAPHQGSQLPWNPHYKKALALLLVIFFLIPFFFEKKGMVSPHYGKP